MEWDSKSSNAMSFLSEALGTSAPSTRICLDHPNNSAMLPLLPTCLPVSENTDHIIQLQFPLNSGFTEAGTAHSELNELRNNPSSLIP